ncbi:MAG TPA: hypothetical protein VKG45_09195 [Actinomycetes bacterium]|nr:hypothetical protein [Actinomycetes bacterium]
MGGEIRVGYSGVEAASAVLGRLADQARGTGRWMLSSTLVRTGGTDADAQIDEVARKFRHDLELLAETLRDAAWDLTIALADYRLTDGCAVPPGLGRR